MVVAVTMRTIGWAVAAKGMVVAVTGVCSPVEMAVEMAKEVVRAVQEMVHPRRTHVIARLLPVCPLQ